jgi:hypothetical protein
MRKRSSKKPVEEPASPPGEAKAEDGAALPATETPPKGKNPAAVALGRLGGLKGGKARREKLSARRRKEIAKKAAQARWAKKADQPSGDSSGGGASS